MIPLRQSTANQEVPLGYFVDSSDGDTEETGLTIANTDVKLWKAGATTLASKNSGGATHIANGIYYAVLDATDTDTVGPLVIFVHVSGALTVRLECVVFEEEVFDDLFASGAVGYLKPTTAGRDLDVSAGGEAGIDWANIGSPTTAVTLSGTTVKTATDVETDTQDIQSRLPAALTGGRMDASLGAIQTGVDLSATMKASVNAEVDTALNTAIPGSPTANSINERIAAIDDLIQSGGDGDLAAVKTAVDGVQADTDNIQTRLPSALVGGRMDSSVGAIASGVDLSATMKASVNAEVDAALNTAIPSSPTANSINERIVAIDDLTQSGGAGDLASIATDAASAATDAATAAATAPDVTAILADTNEIQAELADGGRTDLLIDAIKAATDLLNSAQAEPSGVPAANATPLTKLAYVFMSWRNQIDVTATKKTYYDDSGNPEFEKDLSDDGTTYSESEINAI